MKVLSENRKAYFNYTILEKFEAGIVLVGQEVKSIRAGRLNLAGSYVVLRNGNAYLIGCQIPPYQPLNIQGEYNPERSRRLLLNKSEIQYLIGKSNQKGLTLVPLKMYTKAGRIKLEIGVAKGKKTADKRETIRKRETERDLKRELNIRG
jgi:SsrA-binding protein